MKKDLHPNEYRTVVIQDTSNGYSFLTRSTAATDEKIKWEDGKEYPLVKVHISSDSHPFYTGKEKLVDIEGRVDKFRARREAGEKRREAMIKKAAKPAKKPKSVKQADVPVKLGIPTDEYTPRKPAPKQETKKPASKPKNSDKPQPKADKPQEKTKSEI